MSGFWISSRVSATRRFSPPESDFTDAVRRRAAQRFHRDFELVVERPAVHRVDLCLKIAHFGAERVEIGIGFAHQHGNLVEPFDQLRGFASRLP